MENATVADPLLWTSPGIDSSPENIFQVILLGVFMIFGGSSNGLILIYNVFIKNRNKVQFLEVYILLSSLADFVECVFFMPLEMYRVLTRTWVFGLHACTATKILVFICTTVSQGCNFLLAVCCLVKCVINPHHQFMVRNAVLVAVSMTIIYMVALLPPVISGTVGLIPVAAPIFCWVADTPAARYYYIISSLVTLVLPTGLSLIIHIVIAVRMRRRNMTNSQKSNKKVAISVVGLFIIYMFCLIPYLFVRLGIALHFFPMGATRHVRYFVLAHVAISPVYFSIRIKSLLPPQVIRCCTNAVSPLTFAAQLQGPAKTSASRETAKGQASRDEKGQTQITVVPSE